MDSISQVVGTEYRNPLLRQIARCVPDETRLEDARRLLTRYVDDSDVATAAIPPHYRLAVLTRLQALIARGSAVGPSR